jgi:RAB protein geranylgeranyltransferase component A
MKTITWFIGISIGLLLSLPSTAQVVTREEVLQAASDIQKAVGGTDQLRLRVNRYCHVTITHEPEEALLKVISAHVLNQKFDIPASEMLYVMRASVATEGQLLLWSSDCAETSARKDDPEASIEAMRLASQIMDSHRSLHKANEQFWDLLAKQIATEERSTLHEQ